MAWKMSLFLCLSQKKFLNTKEPRIFQTLPAPASQCGGVSGDWQPLPFSLQHQTFLGADQARHLKQRKVRSGNTLAHIDQPGVLAPGQLPRAASPWHRESSGHPKGPKQSKAAFPGPCSPHPAASAQAAIDAFVPARDKSRACLDRARTAHVALHLSGQNESPKPSNESTIDGGRAHLNLAVGEIARVALRAKHILLHRSKDST